MTLSSCIHFGEVMILRFVVISQISCAFSLLCVSASWNHHLVETIYTECSRRNVPDFGRVFLMLKYNDITQNTYVQS